MQAFKLPPDDDLLELRQQKEDKTWVRVPNTPRFVRFEATVGWSDLQGQGHYADNWALVLGEKEDGNYVFIEEFSGTLAKLAEWLVDAKDRFLIDRIFCQPGEEHAKAREQLRYHEGLTHYSGYRNSLNQYVYDVKKEKWPHFRSRNQTAGLVTAPPELLADIHGGFEGLRTPQAQKRLTLRQETCSVLNLMLKQKPPFKEVLRHPVIIAAIIAINMMYQTRQRHVMLTLSDDDDAAAYPNL